MLQSDILFFHSWYDNIAFLIFFKVLRKVVLIGFAFYLFCKIEAFKRYRVYLVPYGDAQIAEEIRVALTILPLDLILITVAHSLGFFKHGSNTLFHVACTFAVMFVWYELWFYFTHRLFHQKAFYFIHAQHHIARVASPWTAFTFSYMERISLNLGAIGFGVAISHVMPFAIMGFGLYFIANNVMNVLLHCNVEIFPVWFAQGPVGRWIFTPTFHALHHARFQRHYGLFTLVPDRLFNTLWPDYERVQERAANGHGLTTLLERIDEEAASKDAPKSKPVPVLDKVH